MQFKNGFLCTACSMLCPLTFYFLKVFSTLYNCITDFCEFLKHHIAAPYFRHYMSLRLTPTYIGSNIKTMFRHKSIQNH